MSWNCKSTSISRCVYSEILQARDLLWTERCRIWGQEGHCRQVHLEPCCSLQLLSPIQDADEHPGECRTHSPPLWVRLSLFSQAASKEVTDSEEARAASSSLLSVICISLGSAFTAPEWNKGKLVLDASWGVRSKAKISSGSLGLVHGSQLLLCSTNPPAQKLLWCPWLKLRRRSVVRCTTSSWPGLLTRASDQGLTCFCSWQFIL